MLTVTGQVMSKRPKVPKNTPAQLRMSRAHAPGDWLAEAARDRMQMSLNRYAKHLGISVGSLSGYRNGDRPCPLDLAEKMQRELGIPLDRWPAGTVK